MVDKSNHVVWSADLGTLRDPYTIFIPVKAGWDGYSIKIIPSDTVVNIVTNETLPLDAISLYNLNNNKIDTVWITNPNHAIHTPVDNMFAHPANHNKICKFNIRSSKLATIDPFDKVVIVEHISGNTTKIIGARFLSLTKSENSEIDIPFVMKYATGDSYRIRVESGSTLFGKPIRISMSNNFKSDIPKFESMRNNYAAGTINDHGLRTLMTKGIDISKFANNGVVPIIFNTKTQAAHKPPDVTETMDTIPWYTGLKWTVAMQVPNSQVFMYSYTTITGSDSKVTDMIGGWQTFELNFIDDEDRIRNNGNNITFGINRRIIPIRYTITYSGINTVKLIDQAGTVKELGTPNANDRSSKTDGGVIGSMPTIILKVLLKSTTEYHWVPDQVVTLYNGDTPVWTLPYDPTKGVDYRNQMENGRNNAEKWLTIEVPIKPDYSFAISTWHNKFVYH